MDPVEIFREVLKLAVENNASDVVIKSNKPAHIRISGRLKPVDMDAIPGEIVEGFVDESLPRNFHAMWERDGQVDYAYSAEDIGRFRVNAFHQRGTVSVVFRYIKSRPPTFEELNLDPAPLIRLAQSKDGILLNCGATGAGKSSTTAAMLNWINQNLDRHIVTVEDPIEYTFTDDKSVFEQREVGIDVPDFPLAVRAVLRQNPDIIFIGEMRDKETFETAISAAETGHLVFSTMHAATVAQSLTRLFEFFPPDQIVQARRAVSGSLRGFICQRLIPALEGGGRYAAFEILVADVTVRNLLLEGQFDKIQQLLEVGDEAGSKSFNKDLYNLIKSAKISKADGLRFSPNPAALEMNLKGIFIKQ
ncbi:MAG TPA: PilT/PilU family type 4a pilus ATPase [Opitutaceae bacterium]|nr:PilT/PilU family type 4a pilus ATPase [Opitutaceae bacterium]